MQCPRGVLLVKVLFFKMQAASLVAAQGYWLLKISAVSYSESDGCAKFSLAALAASSNSLTAIPAAAAPFAPVAAFDAAAACSAPLPIFARLVIQLASFADEKKTSDITK